MGKRSSRLLDSVIDKLTNSIEHSVTGEVFDTEIVRLTAEDIKLVIPKDWQFTWRKEIKDITNEVYKPGKKGTYSIRDEDELNGYSFFADQETKYQLIVSIASSEMEYEEMYSWITAQVVQ
jgi:hypothetical protein